MLFLFFCFYLLVGLKKNVGVELKMKVKKLQFIHKFKAKIKNFMAKRNVKYNVLISVLIFIFIVFVVVLNLVISKFVDRYDIKLDLSSKRLYKISKS